MPKEIFDIPYLAQLGFAYQPIEKLPPEIKNAEYLRSLILRQTAVEDIQPEILALMKAGTLKRLDVADTPFARELIQKGNDSIKAFRDQYPNTDILIKTTNVSHKKK